MCIYFIFKNSVGCSSFLWEGEGDFSSNNKVVYDLIKNKIPVTCYLLTSTLQSFACTLLISLLGNG